MSKNSEILLTDSAVDFLKEEIGDGGTTVIANPELSGDEPDLTGLQVNDIKYKVPAGGGSIEYVELNSASGTIEVETFQKLDFGGAYIKYNDIVLIPNGREQSGGGLGGTKTCYFDSTVNNNKYLSCVLTASLPLPPNATVPYTITEVSVGGGGVEFVDVVNERAGTVTQEQLIKLQNGAILRCYGKVIYSYLSENEGYLSFGCALRPATDGNSMLAPIIKINEATLEYSSALFIIAVTPLPPIGE